MPWCHVCRLEYGPGAPACDECGGGLVAHAAPERRGFTIRRGGESLHVVATLPPEDALLASGTLDRHGIPASLRPSDGGSIGDVPVAFDVLVSPRQIADARTLLRRSNRRDDPAHTGTMIMIAVVTGAALFLSAVLFAARWLLSGSPLPR